MSHTLAQNLFNPALNPLVGNLSGGRRGTAVLQIFMSNGMTVVFGLGVLVLIVMFLIGAYEYITAGGDKEALQRSTKRISQALIGLLILFSIYLLTYIISSVFGFNILQLNIPQLTP